VVAISDVIFGSAQIRINSQVTAAVEAQNLKQFAPLSLKGVLFNLGSPVDRRRTPFWHWVAQNIFEAEKLQFVVNTVANLKVTAEVVEEPSMIALLNLNTAFLDYFGMTLPPNA
jgi:hypothetical protein